jgi:hypothetical protein
MSFAIKTLLHRVSWMVVEQKLNILLHERTPKIFMNFEGRRSKMEIVTL